MLKQAWVDRTGVEPVVKFQFNEIGAEKFYELTRKKYWKNNGDCA